MIGFNDYKSLVTNKSLLKRSMVACLTMTFQQWVSIPMSSTFVQRHALILTPKNGINAINYYAPFIFQGLVSGNTTNLLATGVVGIIEFVLTIPAVLYVDKFGRKTILIAGEHTIA